MVFNFSVFMNSCCLSLDSGSIVPRFLVLAETQLPISPENSGDAVAKALGSCFVMRDTIRIIQTDHQSV